jgi:hypothetical protein
MRCTESYGKRYQKKQNCKRGKRKETRGQSPKEKQHVGLLKKEEGWRGGRVERTEMYLQ